MKEVMDAKLNSLIKQEVFRHVIKMPEDIKYVECNWIFI